MAEEIRLPPLGQTSDEMAIVEWYKKVGDTVKIAEPLLCVETDKAQVDVESAEEGVVLAILAEPGESLSSGALLAWIGAPGEAVPATADAAPEPLAAPEAEAVVAPASGVPSAAPPAAGGRVQVSPVVRKLAQSLGVDLGTVTGTGPGGRIERTDVEAAAGGGAPAAAIAPAGPNADVSAVRKVIARRLTRSVQAIPQFTIDAHLDARAARDALAASAVEGLTYTHLLLRAIARAARDNPALLRIWSDEGPAFRVMTTPDVGLAVAGDDALYVVTIAEPDAAALPELVARVRAAVARGRAGTLDADDQKPAALSVSNLGMFGVDSFHAIIDPDQTAILAVGTVQDRVVAIDGEPAVVPQLTVSLSCDHRAADGAQAARFLQSLRTYFETDPV